MGKIRGEKYESSEEKYFPGRKKSNPNFNRGFGHIVVFSGRVGIQEWKPNRKKNFCLSPINTASLSLGPPIVGYFLPSIQINWGN